MFHFKELSFDIKIIFLVHFEFAILLQDRCSPLNLCFVLIDILNKTWKNEDSSWKKKHKNWFVWVFLYTFLFLWEIYSGLALFCSNFSFFSPKSIIIFYLIKQIQWELTKHFCRIFRRFFAGKSGNLPQLVNISLNFLMVFFVEKKFDENNWSRRTKWYDIQIKSFPLR